MAAARDHAARIFRTGPDTGGGETSRDASADIADTIRAHLSDETARRTAEAPLIVSKPVAPEPTVAAAPKAGKRKMVFTGVVALLALAAVGYGVHWLLVGRFHISTDDA
jgi:membrane fusion protein, multidrug efflux system